MIAPGRKKRRGERRENRKGSIIRGKGRRQKSLTNKYERSKETGEKKRSKLRLKKSNSDASEAGVPQKGKNEHGAGYPPRRRKILPDKEKKYTKRCEKSKLSNPPQTMVVESKRGKFITQLWTLEKKEEKKTNEGRIQLKKSSRSGTSSSKVTFFGRKKKGLL